MPALRRCSRTRCCSAPVLTADASSPAARSCLVRLPRCLPGPALHIDSLPHSTLARTDPLYSLLPVTNHPAGDRSHFVIRARIRGAAEAPPVRCLRPVVITTMTTRVLRNRAR